MKKILSLVLALAMVLCVFSACGKKANEEEVVRKTVEDCMAALLDGDASALDCVQADSDAYESFSTVISAFTSNEELFASLGAEMGIGDEYYEDVEEIAQNAMIRIFDEASVTIDKVSVDGNNATVEYTLIMPLVGNMESALTDSVMDEIFAELFTEEELDGLQEKLDAMTEEEQEAYMSELMLEVFEELINVMVEAATSDVSETNGTLELEKINGKWLIVNDL